MKHRAPGLLLCLAGLLAACDGAGTPASTPAVETPSATTASSALREPAGPTAAAVRAAAPVSATCPYADFDAFLEHFEARADAQRAATADPLTMTRIDPEAQPEPAAVTTQVPRNQVTFPVLADAATRQAEGSRLRIESRGDNARDVYVGLPDSGAQVHMEFEMRDCWTLVKVDDQSM